MTVLSITRGDLEIVDVTLTGLTTAQMTGATCQFTARNRLDDPTAVLSYTQAAGIQIDLTGATPALHVTIPAADTRNFPAEKVGLFYDIEVSPSDGSGPVTVAADRLLIYPDVF